MASVSGKRRPAQVSFSWRMPHCSGHANPAHVADRRQKVRSYAATVDAPEAVPERLDETPCNSPEALKLESGELSTVIRNSPEAPNEVFRCVGCTDAACQVLIAYACCRLSCNSLCEELPC